MTIGLVLYKCAFPLRLITVSPIRHTTRSLRPLSSRPLHQAISLSRHRVYSTTTATEESPPQQPSSTASQSRPLLPRLLTFLLVALSATAIGTTMAVAPSLPTLQALMNPPTNGETLHLFHPTDAESVSINATLINHPEAHSLRANPSFTESRPHMKIPPAAREHNLTGGVLSGPGRIVVPPLTFAENDGKSYVAMYYLGSDLCGHPGIVHGGLIATIIDEGLARCCFSTLPSKVGMTASLKVDYRVPLPASSFVVLRATTTKTEGRKAWVEGRVETLLTEEQVKRGDKVVVYAEASALFIEPRQATSMAKLYPAAAA